MIDLISLRKNFAPQRVAWQGATALLATEETAYGLAKAAVGTAELGVQVIQHVAQALQEKMHVQIAAIVTKALQGVFDNPYTFKIIFERLRNRTEARLTFWEGDEEINPKGASGGGSLDVASFALRIADIIIRMPPRRHLVILDEPFHFLHGFEERAAMMIHAMARELNIQFIIVTQLPDFRVGKIIEL